MASLITSGVDYAQFFDDLRAVVRHEVLNALTPSPSSTAEVGGISLAQEITRLSKPRIYALVSSRGIPHAKRGNKLYFNRAELLAWVAAGKRGETAL
jgi:excisionase family DNA binding protein